MMRIATIVRGVAVACSVAAMIACSAAAARPAPQAKQAASNQADPVPSAQISRTLGEIIKAHEIPGMVAAIVTGDGSIEIGCAGVRKQGDPQPITIFDRMHIGSCTKSMTATMIATLVEDGTISFETTIGEVFNDPNGSMHEAWRDVTLHQLLSNRSGAPADLDKDDLWRRLWMHRGDATSARMLLVEGVLKHPPDGPPGSKYLYSNAGFAIAGAMVEKVTGKSWEALMIDRLFKPLEMHSAGFGPPGDVRSGKIDQPRGHHADGTAVEPSPAADNPVAIGPAGTVHCSVIDWSRYIAMHLNGARGKDADPALPLKAATFRTLHTPAGDAEAAVASPAYALGWAVMQRPWAGADATSGGRVLTHNGSNTMWFAVTWIAPDADFAVLVACNKGSDAAAKACDEAAAAMIKHQQAQQPTWP